jgi:hypothetical protein
MAAVSVGRLAHMQYSSMIVLPAVMLGLQTDSGASGETAHVAPTVTPEHAVSAVAGFVAMAVPT